MSKEKIGLVWIKIRESEDIATFRQNNILVQQIRKRQIYTKMAIP